jgi:hypothetical protein
MRGIQTHNFSGDRHDPKKDVINVSVSPKKLKKRQQNSNFN